MSEVDKLFENLCFDKLEGEDEIIYRRGYDFICFDLYDIGIDIINSDNSIYLDFEFLLAIYKKCKELGWELD